MMSHLNACKYCSFIVLIYALTGCDEEATNIVSNKAELQALIATGDIEAIEAADTSLVRDMSFLFQGSDLNPDLSNWDTSNVITMAYMFDSATQFNHPIANWDTSNVTNMAYMFHKASEFNQPIVSWDTKNVRNMSSMFEAATSFSQDLSMLDTSSLEQDNNIVAGSGIVDVSYFPPVVTQSTKVQIALMQAVINQDETTIEEMEVSELTSIDYLFKLTNLNPDLSSWDTSNLRSMKHAFQYNDAFNQNLANWNTANVVDMYMAFNGARGLNQDLSHLNTQSVTRDDVAFSGTAITNPSFLPNTPHKDLYAAILNGDTVTVQQYDVSTLSSFDYLFYKTGMQNLDLTSWDTSNVNSMRYVFELSSFDGDVSSWDTSSVTHMDALFSQSAFNGDISHWDTSKVKSMSSLFLVGEFNGDISNWDTSNVTSMATMFSASKFDGDISQWDTSNVETMYGMFGNGDFSQDIGNWDTSKVKDMSHMFKETKYFDQDLSSWNVEMVENHNNFAANSQLSLRHYPRFSQ